MGPQISSHLLSDPLDHYPVLDLSKLKSLNTNQKTFRESYGLELYRQTGQTGCAYCGISFVDSNSNNFTHWLMMSVDHVVPRKTALLLSIDQNIWDSILNLVLCCRSCNDYGNRDRQKVPYQPEVVNSPEAFLHWRRDTFRYRFQKISEKRAHDLGTYQFWVPLPDSTDSD
ncbi:hypothetical protein KDA_30190 [Dictyobacter alpinus]|uniref:HNH domain-containing protein n=1 Tax=Dictyobacter alpinus TaxID=2014873 RepID=A0A402B854_9CHLR|nr:HNH endonuclease [Dictyobacter alpinus]GCE27535.1 hypothetical protein KDA_30190 [Dictyobacter alpinus]